MTQRPWARSRGLQGRDVVVGMYLEWDALVRRFLAGYAHPSVTVDDPRDDRSLALQRIRAAARPTAAGA
ncbi:hypothetical protein [Pseudonocardia sp. GCM10023141]|uniref:hypothetical protein n=1 Tax=Pseudonocardia sp. GCM10023141 TaxID=3252653 RepID=UPI00360FA2FB